MNEEDLIGYCSICERPIYDGDKHYRMPDGDLVCEDILCVDEWLWDYECY